MNFFADIKPLKARALDGECGPAVLNAIGNKLRKLDRVKNTYQLTQLLRGKFLESEVQRTANILANAGFISSHRSGTGDLKKIKLTDAGWAASGVDKPFHLGGAA